MEDRPAFCHAFICRHASYRTHSPIGMISPVYSASEMNPAGWMRTCSGCHLRLRVELELLVLERAPKLLLQGQAAGPHALRELARHLAAVSPFDLHAVHRAVGALQEAVRAVAMFRKHRDADAGRHAQLVASDDVRLGKSLQNLPREV